MNTRWIWTFALIALAVTLLEQDARGGEHEENEKKKEEESIPVTPQPSTPRPGEESPYELRQRIKNLDRVIRKRYEQAHKAYARAKYDECIALCEEVLTYQPDHLKAQRLRWNAEIAKQRHAGELLEAESRYRDESALEEATKAGIIPSKRPRLPRPKLPSREDLMGSKKYEKIQALLNQRIGMRFIDVDLEYVLKLLFEASGVNIVADQALLEDKTITLHVENMPLREILKFIERNFDDLAFTVSEDAVWITSPQSPMLVPRVYPLNYGLLTKGPMQMGSARGGGGGGRSVRTGAAGAKGKGTTQKQIQQAVRQALQGQRTQAGGGGGGGSQDSFLEDLMSFLEGFVDLWPDGSQWMLDRKTNSLFVLTSPEMHHLVSEMLDVIDRVPVQIRIQVRFVEIRMDEDLAWGVDWSNILGGKGNLSQGFPQDLSGVEQGFKADTTVSVVPSQTLSFAYLGVQTKPRFTAALTALEKSGRAKTLAAPSILALNNQTATIDISTSINVVSDYREISQSAQSQGINVFTPSILVPSQFDEIPIGFFLEVTPSVGRDMKTIILDLHPVVTDLDDTARFEQFQEIPVINNDQALPDFSNLDDQQIQRLQQFQQQQSAQRVVKRPTIATRELTTKLILEDGMTVVLGGLMRTRKSKIIKKVPILGSIPFLGWLFRSEAEHIEKTNLIIIVRATIVTPSGQTYYDPPPEDELPVGQGANVEVGDASSMPTPTWGSPAPAPRSSVFLPFAHTARHVAPAAASTQRDQRIDVGRFYALHPEPAATHVSSFTESSAGVPFAWLEE